MRELLEQLLTAVRAGRGVTFCRLVETRGSTPQKPGAAMLVFADGSQAGTLGGGCVEADVKRQALATLGAGAARIVQFQLDDDYGWDDGLICGGRMQVAIDPVVDAATRDYIEQLSRLAEEGGTEAVVYDAKAGGLPEAACYLFDAQDKLVAHVGGPLEGNDAPAAVREGLRPLAKRPRPTPRHTALPICRCCSVAGW